MIKAHEYKDIRELSEAIEAEAVAEEASRRMKQ
jgi:hypothetical protein